MALTPRILLKNPAAAAVAALTIFGLTVTSTSLMHSWTQSVARFDSEIAYQYEAPCAGVAEQLGEQEMWSEAAWVTYAVCFQERNDSRMAIRTAREGLQDSPRSEPLWNIVAYHHVVLGQYDEAERSLRYALRIIEPTTGTMENNLAWVGLWNGRVATDEMRILYASALEREPQMCEALHTGLMVEYAISQKARTNYEEAEALKRFQLLRERYDVCESRVQSGQWEDVVEVAGATILYREVDQRMGVTYNLETARDLKTVGDVWRSNFSTASVSAMCGEAIPATLRVNCENVFIGEALREQTRRSREARAVITHW